MSLTAIVPERMDLALWRGDISVFDVFLTDDAGLPLDVSAGTWEASFAQGGTITVDPAGAASGHLVLTVIDLDGVGVRCRWELRDTTAQKTARAGEVTVRP